MGDLNKALAQAAKAVGKLDTHISLDNLHRDLTPGEHQGRRDDIIQAAKEVGNLFVVGAEALGKEAAPVVGAAVASLPSVSFGKDGRDGR
jgi:hypothetical protein